MHTYSNPTKRKKSNANSIRVPGRGVVGNVIGNEYRRRITDTHILRNPPAIANDIQVLHDAERAGAAYCVFTHKVTGIVYRAAIAKIWDMGFTFNRGYGDQIGLELSLWLQTRPANFEHTQTDAPEYGEPSDTHDVKPLKYKSRATVGVVWNGVKQMTLWDGE